MCPKSTKDGKEQHGCLEQPRRRPAPDEGSIPSVRSPENVRLSQGFSLPRKGKEK